MKTCKAIALLSIFAISTLSFFSCKKDRTLFDAHFFITDTLQTERLYLYINSEPRGELPLLIGNFGMNSFSCNDSLLDSALNFKLLAGKYRIQARDGKGRIIMNSNMEFGKNGSSSSSSGSDGYFRMGLSGNCLQVWGDKFQ